MERSVSNTRVNGCPLKARNVSTENVCDPALIFVMLTLVARL